MLRPCSSSRLRALSCKDTDAYAKGQAAACTVSARPYLGMVKCAVLLLLDDKPFGMGGASILCQIGPVVMQLKARMLANISALHSLRAMLISLDDCIRQKKSAVTLYYSTGSQWGCSPGVVPILTCSTVPPGTQYLRAHQCGRTGIS